MRKEQNTEYTKRLRQRIKEFVDGITATADLEMIYGMASAGFRESRAGKGRCK